MIFCFTYINILSYAKIYASILSVGNMSENRIFIQEKSDRGLL